MKNCKKCGTEYASGQRKEIGICVACRFLSLIDKTSSQCGCWLWTGKIDSCGYGRFLYAMSDGIRERATHRISWIIANGAIPDGMCVLHNCDEFYQAGDISNRLCLNPEHMRLGTHRENMADCVLKGRFAKGDASGLRLHPERVSRGVSSKLAKLDDDKVREIRSSTESGESLGRRFGVAYQTIRNAKLGITWCHVV